MIVDIYFTTLATWLSQHGCVLRGFRSCISSRSDRLPRGSWASSVVLARIEEVAEVFRARKPLTDDFRVGCDVVDCEKDLEGLMPAGSDKPSNNGLSALADVGK